MFVDDCKCLHTISTPVVRFRLQQDHDILQSWSSDWKLAFNPSNANILCFQHLLGNIVILISLMKLRSLMQLTTGILVLTSLINFHLLTTTPLLLPKPIILFTFSVVLSHLTIPSSPNYFIYISCQNLLALPTAVESGALTFKNIKYFSKFSDAQASLF